MTQNYVVVLNWNGWRDTIDCLESLFPGDVTSCRVLVCDNGSLDDSVARIWAWGRERFAAACVRLTRNECEAGAQLADQVQLAIIENGANLGFAAGNNVGIRLALRNPACTHVWILNNDTVVRPDALQKALDRMAADPHIGLCGSTLLYRHESDTVQAMGGAVYLPWSGRSIHIGAFKPHSSVPADGAAVEAQFSYVVGAAMLASRNFIEQVGLMREDYFLYSEELDWAARASGRFRLGYAPASVVLHKEGASIGTSANCGSPLSLYFLFRNRVRFSWRFHRTCVVTVCLFCMLDIAKLLIRRRWPQALAALHGLLQLPRPLGRDLPA